MFDYKLLAALEAVVQEGSFDKAARLLCLTQSAVSQRIRLLEERLGQMLVVRGTPARATAAGHRLLRHVRQVGLLEQELLGELQGDADDDYVALPVGLNNDSLSTWFLDAVGDCVARERLLLQLTVEDEGHTLALLKNGDVIGCVTSTAQAATGCVSHRLGIMRYRCIATAEFAARHFAAGVGPDTLRRSPGIIFNRRDTLHLGTLETRFGIGIAEFPLLIVPSVQSLLDAVERGLGYGICPELQVTERLAQGSLVDLLPDEPPEVTLYWQCWALQTPRLERFSATLLAEARRRLPQ
ncbi:LysR family transcriptional regulator ArgP [Crenobacter sp. SG2303]|uniref:LysR family transcriptional regulator ArgP n=1 Tax=Crenobacter oryzisoli TaxID=3056844 RepID=A0ABT7XKR4_9NEIS|nr:LysR family transcriptional regulator ArgP [Crenobacter sp. SG2303]MDN0074370.1 LysR family transcriptional regulator ArgP [Crenobacter sp. SG2303]